MITCEEIYGLHTTGALKSALYEEYRGRTQKECYTDLQQQGQCGAPARSLPGKSRSQRSSCPAAHAPVVSTLAANDAASTALINFFITHSPFLRY